MSEKIAVILFNLGGPDRRGAIRPFLINFFMDPAIIGAPWPIRFILSRYIAWKRSRRQAGSAYARLGYKSPLLENTALQAAALRSVLNHDTDKTYSVHVCMNYWHPMPEQVAKDVVAENPARIILLPLYPQFSTTTSGSSRAFWTRAAEKAGITAPTHFVCCYPEGDGFIAASAENIRKAYDDLREKHQGMRAPRVLFSAHGLPKKVIRGGDPYQRQCEMSAAAIAARMGIPDLDWMVCYQSRVGPLEWTGPSSEEAIECAAKDGVPVVIYPHAFVSEHVETLVEIEHDYRALAHELGVPGFARAGTVMTHPAFIEDLAAMVRAAPMEGICGGHGVCPCKDGFSKCPAALAGPKA